MIRAIKTVSGRTRSDPIRKRAERPAPKDGKGPTKRKKNKKQGIPLGSGEPERKKTIQKKKGINPKYQIAIDKKLPGLAGGSSSERPGVESRKKKLTE